MQQQQANGNIGAGMHFSASVGGGVHGHPAGCGCGSCPQPCPPQPKCSPHVGFSSRKSEGACYPVKVHNPRSLVAGCAPEPCRPQPVCNDMQAVPNQGQQQLVGSEMQAQNIQQPLYPQLQPREGLGSGYFGDNTQKVDITHEDNRRKASIYMSLSGTHAQLASSGEVVWKYKDEAGILDMKDSGGKVVGDKSNVVIFGAKVKFAKNDFPVDLLISFDKLDGNVYSAAGKKGNIIVPRKSKITPTGDDQNLHRHSVYQHDLLKSKYADVDQQSIREGIQQMSGLEYSLVHPNNPCIHVLRDSGPRMEQTLAAAYVPQMNCYKIGNSIVDKCIQKIQEDVTDKLPYINVKDDGFTARVYSADGKKFDDLSSVSGISDLSGSARRDLLNTVFTVSVCIELDYSMKQPRMMNATM